MINSQAEIPIYANPSQILKHLIKFNTTNPPGNEAPCIGYVKSLLDWSGIQNTIVAADPSRPNLIARIPGLGNSPPLLLYGHVDVVTTANQVWKVNPFAGEEIDGYIWGRGALDMKGALAMMLSAVMTSKLEGPPPPGDVILAVLSDEESTSAYGAEYLVNNHGYLFQGVKYAIGEFGGFPVTMSRRRFYPIMVAEKQGCGILATIRGRGGHGAWPARGGIMRHLAYYLYRLERRLPVHITPVAREQIRATAENLPFPLNHALRQLLIPSMTNLFLDMLGPSARMFDPILHNTVAVTAIQAGESYNMIPSQVSILLDVRVLPGFTADDVIDELEALAGRDVEYQTMVFSPGPSEPNMGLFYTLAAILKKADPEGIPIPMMLPAVTDARLFSRLGIQTYGFTPLNLPPEIKFEELFHAADERVPVQALQFGTDALRQLLQRF